MTTSEAYPTPLIGDADAVEDSKTDNSILAEAVKEASRLLLNAIDTQEFMSGNRSTRQRRANVLDCAELLDVLAEFFDTYSSKSRLFPSQSVGQLLKI